MPLTRRAFVALALALFAAAAGADDLTTGGGKKLTGKLVGIDAQGATFSTGDARVTVAGKDILLIDLGHAVAPVPKDTKYHEIELTDGSTFRVAKYAVKGKKLETELATVPAGVPAPAFELPLGSVFSVMRNADDPKHREAWKKVLAGRGKRDMYVELTTDGLNPIQGTILSGSDDGKTFEFELEGGGTKSLLQRSATGGLIFSQPVPAQVPQTLCKVVDVFGNTLTAREVQVGTGGEGVTVTTVSGVAVKYPALAGIARFDYAQGNVAYLSDLVPQVNAPPVPPDEAKLNPTAPFFRDKGVSGDPIRLGTEVFPKGLVVAADVELTYAIGGDYREFKAVLGMPENAIDANLEAKVTIEADGQVKFSETIRRKDKPRPIGLDVKGVKQLRVIVQADLPVTGNRIVLADARVQK